ncbi:MAG: hypothetical protein M0P71_00865 [Melioribacteraceae bacterium]|nr:hypothetical protein [Melioribacteraceae bacterium]
MQLEKGFRVKIKEIKNIDIDRSPGFTFDMESVAEANKRIFIILKYDNKSKYYKIEGKNKVDGAWGQLVSSLDFSYTKEMFDLDFTKNEIEIFKEISDKCENTCKICSYGNCPIIKQVYEIL